VDVDGITIGGQELAVIAGPCSVESWQQLITTARAVRDAGARFLRGGHISHGARRTVSRNERRGAGASPGGAGRDGLKIVTEARDALTLPAVAEVATSFRSALAT